MSDASLPDRLSTDPASPYYNGELLQAGVRILLNDTEKTNVEEYCISEGWVRIAVGRSLDRKGRPMTMKLKGVVTPFMSETPPAA